MARCPKESIASAATAPVRGISNWQAVRGERGIRALRDLVAGQRLGQQVQPRELAGVLHEDELILRTAKAAPNGAAQPRDEGR